MRYQFPDLMQSHPRVIQSALAVGRLSTCHMFIELPNNFDFQGEPPEPVIRGMGDIVASFAKPIAKAIDSIAGTDIQHCGGCASRQEALNETFPL